MADGQLLGKGTFSDVFKVFATVVGETPRLKSLGTDKDDLNKLLDAKFSRRRCSWGDTDEGPSHGGGVEESDNSNQTILTTRSIPCSTLPPPNEL